MKKRLAVLAATAVAATSLVGASGASAGLGGETPLSPWQRCIDAHLEVYYAAGWSQEKAEATAAQECYGLEGTPTSG